MADPSDTSKSYLPASITALSPWTSRSATPVPPQQQQGQNTKSGSDDNEQSGRKRQVSDTGGQQPASLNAQRGGDHSVRMRRHHYTAEVPTPEVRWFHAVDFPKRKPVLLDGQPTYEKVTRPARKFVPFSKRDSRNIEAAFQRWSEEDEAAEKERQQGSEGKEEAEKSRKDTNVTVPVNEDYLFDVNVLERELQPAYWEGLVYEVKRGLWFNSDGTVADENLSMQLEDGYLKVKPWKFPPPQQASKTKARSRPTSWKAGEEAPKMIKSNSNRPLTPEQSKQDGNADDTASNRSPNDRPEEEIDVAPTAEPQLNKTHRLFGAYMNSVVTYQDSSTAWLLTDDFLSRMSSTMYQRFAGGGHFAGVKLTRGYTDPTKKADKITKDQASLTTAAKSKDSPQEDNAVAVEEEDMSPESEKKKRSLVRAMSSLVESTAADDPQKQEDEAMKREEMEIQDDYKDDEADEQGRDIEHLLLVTHGIGQRLGMRMESINFIHDVNTLRKTFKSVYQGSADLQALNSELQSMPKNCRIQVLPIVWRQKLNFPKQSLKHNREELDLGDAALGEDDEYPTLDQITVDGVPAVRNLITDLALDVLLYQSPAYKGHISHIVVEEANRIFHLFKDRNPNFRGKVSLVGHSLGSAVMFDLLCRQKSDNGEGKQFSSIRHKRRAGAQERSLAFDFHVEDFYALGSPIGLFQMLKGRTIAARQGKDAPPPETPDDDIALDEDPFDPSSAARGGTTATTSGSTAAIVSPPKCERLFNIFHPSDPIAYRIEPLISPAMATLKPQPLPYTKRGIFGAPVGQGLTGIGARVGQSISGMWSNVSSSLASSVLNRSLGITSTDGTTTSSTAASSSHPGSVGPHLTPAQLQHYRLEAVAAAAGNSAIAVREGDDGERPPTLIDAEIETLYAGFQRRRASESNHAADAEDKNDQNTTASTPAQQGPVASASDSRQDMDIQARRLKREEGKVRALNANGRVDYSIQEGAFDISLLASIASHLSYWSDEDVVHFMSSQLLARHRVVNRVGEQPGKGAVRGDGEKKVAA